MPKQARTEKQREKLLDAIKDEIDRLSEIPTAKRRREAARDLIEYLTLHHVDNYS